MFNPTRDQVRIFFADLWRKYREGMPLAGLEPLALDLVLAHPEYHELLADRDAALAREWTPEGGETNPFLHMQMHLAIEEQVSIDQPPGIRAAVEALAAKRGSRHDALHDVMECLGEVIWQAQRNGLGFDNTRYLDCIRGKGG